MDDRVFLDLVDRCYRTIDATEEWQEIVVSLADGLGADAGDISIEDYDSGIARPVGTLGFDDHFRENYDEDFLGSNGWVDQLKRFPRRRAFCSDAEPVNFDRTAYYNEWMRPQRLRHGVGSILEDSHERLVLVGFMRNGNRQPFSADDARSLDRVLPHIHQSIRMGERLRAAGGGSRTLFALVDSLHLPALLVDETTRILHANARTETLARLSADLSLTGGRIAAVSHVADQALQTALEVACSIDLKSRSAARDEVVVPRADGGPPIVVELIPLRSGHVSGFREPRCLVIVNDPDFALPTNMDLLRKAFGLTPAEARLAWALANGQRIGDYAETNAISAGTARWHLKNLQAKTGAHTLEAVVGLVHATILRF